MKIIFLASIMLLSLASVAEVKKNDLSINLQNEKLNILLLPLWQKIPYQYDFSNFYIQTKEEELISYKVKKGNIKLGQEGSPLFSLSPNNTEDLIINWRLQDLEAYIELKVRFKYQNFGVQITHDEVFVIKAKNILKARSIASVHFSEENEKLEVSFHEHQNFNFESINIEPKDGIGSVLRYIFDNIFSRSEVDRYIIESVNEELAHWLSEDHLEKDIQVALNEMLNNTQENTIDLPQLASRFSINLNEFTVNGSQSIIETNFMFKNSYPQHQCANLLTFDSKSDISIQTSHKLIQTLINNIGTKLRFENGIAHEPLFCFGFKTYDEEGKPKGDKLTTRFLGKNIRINYWIKPLELPIYNYNSDNQTMIIELKVDLEIKSQGYPKVSTQKNLVLDIRTGFRIKQDSEGLKLINNDFAVKSIKGLVKLKWGRFTPKINLPLKTLRLALNKSIKKEIQDLSLLILPSELSINNSSKLILKNYELLDNSHSIQLDIEDLSEVSR